MAGHTEAQRPVDGVVAIADAHAPVAALWGMRAAEGLSVGAFLHGALVAISVNACSRTAVAWAAGGRRYAMGIGGAFAVGLTVVWCWDAFMN